MGCPAAHIVFYFCMFSVIIDMTFLIAAHTCHEWPRSSAPTCRPAHRLCHFPEELIAVCTFPDETSHIHHSICILMRLLFRGFSCHSHGSLLLALLDCWCTACFGSGSHVRLCYLVSYLSQFGFIYTVIYFSCEHLRSTSLSVGSLFLLA